MRLFVLTSDTGQHIGMVEGEQVWLARASGSANLAERVGTDTLGQFITHLRQAGPVKLTLDDLPSPVGKGDGVSGMRFSAPLCPPTGDVIAIGRNYAEHAGEMARAGGGDMERPTVFSKAQTSVSGPADRIAIDARVSTQIDWEAELGVVIGRTCRNVRPEDALACVFGYTVLNDISARDLQYGWGGQFYKGKSLDGYCPIGPWIVTADEVADPQNLEITLRVNGEVKQRGHTSDMIFPVSELISQLSLGQTLRPGTLIATGTPPGVGYARDPKEFLRPGDVMETEIAGIGLLRNRVVAAEDGLDPDELHPGG